MKKSSLDISMNLTLDTLFNAPIDTVDKLELLMNLRLFFMSYKDTIGGVKDDKIETIDFRKVK